MNASLRAALNQYANREIDLAEFEDWIVGNFQVILDSHDQESIDIANTLDARFIEFGEALITEQDFFNEAQAMVPPPDTLYPVVRILGIVQSSGNVTIHADIVPTSGARLAQVLA